MAEQGSGQDAVMEFETKQLQVRIPRPPKAGPPSLVISLAGGAKQLTHAQLFPLLFPQELQQSRNELLSRVANLKKVNGSLFSSRSRTRLGNVFKELTPSTSPFLHTGFARLEDKAGQSG